jgi:hypothetical protein
MVDLEAKNFEWGKVLGLFQFEKFEPVELVLRIP